MPIHFNIIIPEENVEDARAALEEAGVYFNPREQMVPDNSGSEYPISGETAAEVLERVNKFIREDHAQPTVTGNPDDWDLPTLQQFLDFADANFNWSDGRVEYAWWEGSPDEYARLVSRNRLIFPQVPEGAMEPPRPGTVFFRKE